jgi:multidrug efflux pump subunit AcrB
VKNIYTTVLDGVSTTTVEFILEKNISDAVNDVRDAVARVKADMPAELRDPTVTKATTAGRVVLTFTASRARPGENSTPGTELVRRQHRRQAPAGVRGVGAVKRVGGVYREIRVELDDARMAALRVSALDVSRQLRQVQKEAPGGRGDVSGAEQSVRTIATVQTAAELAAIDLPLPDGRRVRLDQVATVTDTVAEPRAVALQDGKPVVGFEIFRTKGASETEVAKARAPPSPNCRRPIPKSC